VKLWSTATYRQLLTLKGHKDRIAKIVFSPDNKILATSSWDKTVKLWRAATNTDIHAYQPPLSWIKGSQYQQIPLNALSASKESSGEALYVCRVQKQGYGNIFPGKVVNGSCSISEQDGEEHVFPQYEILVNATGEWKNSDDSATNLREFAAGSVNGKLVNMCRAEHSGGVYIGRVDAGECSFGWRGKEIRTNKYEVFYLKP
jgi:WD40 repeat protein